MPRNPTELLIRELKAYVWAFSPDLALQPEFVRLVGRAVEDYEKATEAAKKPRKAKE